MLEIDIIKEVESDYDEFLSPISAIQRQKQDRIPVVYQLSNLK
jgi:hypothetical protein